MTYKIWKSLEYALEYLTILIEFEKCLCVSLFDTSSVVYGPRDTKLCSVIEEGHKNITWLQSDPPNLPLLDPPKW